MHVGGLRAEKIVKNFRKGSFEGSVARAERRKFLPGRIRPSKIIIAHVELSVVKYDYAWQCLFDLNRWMLSFSIFPHKGLGHFGVLSSPVVGTGNGVPWVPPTARKVPPAR